MLALIWDLLVWLLIFFPLFLGGLWIQSAHLKVELAELAVPALLMGTLGIILKWGCGVPLERTRSWRIVHHSWLRWRNWIETQPERTLGYACLIQTAIWSVGTVRRHQAFGSGVSDLGIFTNAIWNLVNGNGYVSSVKNGMNLFSDHQSPIFWLFAPVFIVFQQPETLLILQALILASGGIALFKLGEQYLERKEWTLAALPLLYWTYLPLRNAVYFDFHPESAMLPIFLWAIWALQSELKKIRWAGVLFFTLGLCCKESAGPVAVGMGLAWILGAGPSKTRSFTRSFGLLSIILGTAVFLLDTQWIPKLFGREYAYNSLYAKFGGGVKELLLAPFMQPGLFWTTILGPARLKFLFWTLAPLSFLPLLGWRCFLVAVPGYLMLFLSGDDHRVNPNYHYAIEPAVGLFWALPGALSLVWHKVALKPRARLVVMVMIPWMALIFYGRSDAFKMRLYTPTSHHQWLRNEFVSCLNPLVTIAASGGLVPHIATRLWAHHLPAYSLPNGSTVDCVIKDDDLNNWPMAQDDFLNFDTRMSILGLSPTYRCKSLTVLQSAWSKYDCMSCVPSCPQE